ncbi:phosphorylase [Alicyclobacillus acidoterrestris]|uniref:Phosphorylase n=1 Tax=Alicyclobacillus acidoterrestris (strain ATCC 49025 / DSM 3922 / CIP 106132 / NCIMB 13137 / GD3B) TaxID=1356854 RepID=A0A9E6ZF52_ALIAG|nr:phosphorylase [Alicyclobacillus acidoterrestris]UNO48675.1 phosphorylase [Alicyclobacillus acidoterrestris]
MLAAMRFEASVFAPLQREDAGRWRVEVTGIGPESARRESEVLIRKYRPRFVVGVGLCGALDSTLTRRTVVIPATLYRGGGDESLATSELPESVVSEIQARVEAQPRLLARSPHSAPINSGGAMVSVETVAASPAEKQALATRYGANSVDQESYAWCEVAQSYGVPAAIVRVVLDEARDLLPQWRNPRGWPQAALLPYRALTARRVLQAIGRGLSCVRW